MREFINILNEASIVDNGRESGCKVWRNPTQRDIIHLTEERDLRGLVDGNTVYVWPAEMATHRMIPTQIGIPFHDYLLPFYIESDTYGMQHGGTRAQWCDGEPDYEIGTAKVFTNHIDFVLDDYLYSQGFARMVGAASIQWGEEPKAMNESASILMQRASENAYREYIERETERLEELISEFKQDTNPTVRWRVAPAARVIKIWQDAAKNGFVRDVKGLDAIAKIFYDNIVQIGVNNLISGHTELSGEDALEEHLDPEDMEAFVDWAIDTPTGWRISDYGFPRLGDLAALLLDAETPEDKLTICDAIMNVTHQRSDLASWFVEGGSATLDAIASA
jgi:hypothetical protein